MLNDVKKGDFSTHTQLSFEKHSCAGRSLTEMLGVLAVMGIIAIAGVKLFHSAMNSHQANELIYEAQKRATTVAAQILAGKNDLSLVEFKNPQGHTFGVEANPQNAEQFNITITGVDADVCKKMKTVVGENTSVRVVSEFCDKLTFNNDLSRMVYASDIQTKTVCEAASNVWCAGSNTCADSDCCKGKILGVCEGCSETGSVTGTAKEGQTCDYHGGVGVCHNGACEAKSTEANCTAGGPRCLDPNYGTCCPMGYMCTSNGDVAGICMKFGTEIDCTTNADCIGKYGNSKPWCKITNTLTSGTCAALESGVTKTVYGLGQVKVSANQMNWWTAKNWCEAQNKRLINVEDFQAYYSGTQNLVRTGVASGYRACAKGKTCCDWNVTPCNRMWNQNTVTDAADMDGTYGPVGELYRLKFSPIFISLAEAFKGSKNIFWTASDAGPDSSGNTVFEVNLTTAALLRAKLNYGDVYALCQ